MDRYTLHPPSFPFIFPLNCCFSSPNEVIQSMAQILCFNTFLCCETGLMPFTDSTVLILTHSLLFSVPAGKYFLSYFKLGRCFLCVCVCAPGTSAFVCTEAHCSTAELGKMCFFFFFFLLWQSQVFDPYLLLFLFSPFFKFFPATCRGEWGYRENAQNAEYHPLFELFEISHSEGG